MSYKKFEKTLKKIQKMYDDAYDDGAVYDECIEKIKMLENEIGDESSLLSDWFSISGEFPFEFIQEKEKIVINSAQEMYNFITKGR